MYLTKAFALESHYILSVFFMDLLSFKFQLNVVTIYNHLCFSRFHLYTSKIKQYLSVAFNLPKGYIRSFK